MNVWGNSWSLGSWIGWATSLVSQPPSLVLGELKMYAALSGIAALTPAVSGEPTAAPALEGTPVIDRWIQ